MFNELERINNFKYIKSKEDLLYILNVSLPKYNYLIYQKRNLYTSFYINKKQGGKRKILAPCFDLCKIQKDLNIIINNNYTFNEEVVHGFLKGKSIKSNAIIHKDSNYILNIDLKNFFDTIHFGRVRGMFMNSPFSFSNYIATNLAKVVCYEKKLPQGAPTSPTISNIICYRMDRELKHICKKYNCEYTRYADDITISTKMLYFPKGIAKFIDNKVIISEYILNTIKKEGFMINYEKINFSPLNERQEVTGLIVNKKVNIKKVYLKELRALLNNTSKYGFYIEGAKFFDKGSKLDFNNREMIEKKFISVLKGKIEFLKMVRGIEDRVYIKYASIFNKLIGQEFFNVDYGKEIKEFIENRTFPLLSYDNMTQGSCFMSNKLGLVTSTHILVNKDAYFDKNQYEDCKKNNCFNFLNSGGKPIYILDHYNKMFLFNPIIEKKHIETDVLYSSNIHIKKEFKINDSYDLKIGDCVYIAGYGEFKNYHETSINYIEAKVSGFDTFDGKKFACISEKIYHGMSGGPVINKEKEVIGIVYVGLNIVDYGTGTIPKYNGFILFENNLTNTP